MTPCPSDEVLAAVLADALSAEDLDAVARHVEGCASCQDALARLSNAAEDDTWQQTCRMHQGSEEEEELVAGAANGMGDATDGKAHGTFSCQAANLF